MQTCNMIYNGTWLESHYRDYVWLQTSVIITEDYNVMGNSEELIGTTEYLTV